jgi:8-oxo-dGTP pyrophosphatase MutT (NUDIX family)
MGRAPVTPREAGTVVLLRDAAAGLEVLMLRRREQADFAADAWVFPGGAVDAADRLLPAERWDGIDPVALAPRFGAPPAHVLGFHVAAVRETFEEAGLLLARHEDGRPADPRSAAACAARGRLMDGAGGAAAFAGWLAGEGLVLDLGALAYDARWVTPAQVPKRYDTCFFLAQAPPDQSAAHDPVETAGQRWLRPAEALERAAAGEMLLWYPTEHALRALGACATVQALLARARERAQVPRVQPHLEQGPQGPRIVHPDDPAYPHERYRPGGDLAEPAARGTPA